MSEDVKQEKLSADNEIYCKADNHSEKRYSAEEITRDFRNAVVEIHSEFILLGDGLIGATGGTPLGPNTRTDIILEGNGFFIKGHYIITPSQLVLLPPSLTSTVNRYPLLNPLDVTLGTIKNQMIRASRILVSVFNVNNNGSSFVYEADLTGVDGAGDIAILKINPDRQWNSCNPCIDKYHPYLKFGSSRCSLEGEKVYLIGDYISNVGNSNRRFNATKAISVGVISDRKHLDYSGYMLAESILVSAPAYSISVGLPILNSFGRVIGMQTTDLAETQPPLIYNGTQRSSGYVSGPSEFFMRRVIKTIIKGIPGSQLEIIIDPAGPYYRYKKAYAGIAYNIFTGVDYDITRDYTSPLSAVSHPRVRLTSNGEFLNSPPYKELVGILVTGIAGLNPNDATGINNGLIYVPGGIGVSPLPASLPVSPFLNKLSPGDVITHINRVAVGDLDKQIAPSLITWRLNEGDTLEVCFRRGGNALSTADNSITENYEGRYIVSAPLTEMSKALDYPYYAIHNFPLLLDRGFLLPPGQNFNQTPSLQDGGVFSPSI